MSKKQNKKHAKTKAKRTELTEMDNHLLKTTFPLEVEGLPLEKLTEREQEIAIKCKNLEELTSTEFMELKELLGRYRKVVMEYKPNETIDNFDKSLKIIKSEKELLKLLDNTKRYDLKMRYRVGRKNYLLSLKVNPIISNSQYIAEMDAHLKLFRGLNTNERVIMDKVERDAPLSQEETKMAEHINKKIEELLYTGNNTSNNINEFLARQVEFENVTITNFKDKVKFWDRIDYSYKLSLYNKVRDILGLTETYDEDLFLDD